MFEKKHGMAGTKEYRRWKNIKTRCLCKSDPHYSRWGGRGISLYEPWQNDFMAFYDYVSKLEHFGEEGYSLDRIDNDGNYEPGNLRWATLTTQSRNTRNAHKWTYKGVCMTLTEWADKCGIPRATLNDRLLKLGWDFEKAISTPVMKRSEWSNRKVLVGKRLDNIERYHESKITIGG